MVLSVVATSTALCQRSAESFARQVLTSAASIGGNVWSGKPD